MKTLRQFVIISSFVLAHTALTGCEFIGPKPLAKLPLEPALPNASEGQEKVIFSELQNKPAASNNPASKELYPAEESRVIRPNLPVVHDRPRGAGSYSLNFDDADLGEVAKVILSDILKQNYVLSPKVGGKVTLQTTQALTKEELLPTLEMLLQMNNAALIKDDQLYRIEPSSEATYSSDFSTNSKLGFQVRVIPVKNVSVENIVDVLKPLLQERTVLNIDKTRNLLIVAGSSDELSRVVDMANTFDVDVLKGRSFGIFPLAHVEPETVIEELEAVFDKTDEDSFFRFLPIDRLNAVMAITHQAKYLKDIETWVVRLDKANTNAGGGVNVYKVQHADAVELAATLNDIFTGASSARKKSKVAKIAPGQQPGQTTNKPAENTPEQKPFLSRGSQGEDSHIADIGNNVKIIADEPNNSIIIVSTAQEYDVIRAVINQLDILPLQVLIDATIVSVTLTDNLQYGIQWFLTHDNSGTNVITSGGGASAASIAAAAVTGGFGYSFISRSGQIRAVLNAQALDNKVNVISSPSLMVLNNQEASIQVGDEIPLRTTESTNTNSGAAAANPIQTSSIQQRKTGVKLKVKPRVNASGLVIMDIEQSVETASNTTTSNIDSPTIQSREITSNVAVQSGETIVLGGLIDDNNTNNKTGVPFFHEIPILGPLFGSNTRNKVKTELVVLITPRVVKSRQDAGLIANEFRSKLTGIYDVRNKPSKDQKYFFQH
ncbi:MAG: type II secretion system secretin GspD [Methylococcaceae bacterium]|jgi:general secretion pathway protein D